MIPRILRKSIQDRLFQGKAILLMGARQVGKTTLLKQLFREADALWLNADELDVQALFAQATSTRLKSVFGNKKIVVIDEAQRIADVGLKLKLIIDEIPDVQLVATGSSSFELANRVNEPLTGRKWEYKLFPLSFGEMAAHHGVLEEKRLIPQRLVYGYYPDVVCHPGSERERLVELTSSYLFKDILAWERLRKPECLVKLLQALAFQVGSEVSFRELGEMTSLDSKTTEKYVVLLEQCHVVFRLGSFHRNLRNELKSSRKFYFYDNGIRNALIANFNGPELRQDVGALWENFVAAERIKALHYRMLNRTCWFWRTAAQKEVDWLEEGDGRLTASEFKWNPHKTVKLPGAFAAAYPDAAFRVVHPDNFEDFLNG
mgnify:FL=1